MPEKKDKIDRSQPWPLRRWWDGLDDQERKTTTVRSVWMVVTIAAVIASVLLMREMERKVMGIRSPAMDSRQVRDENPRRKVPTPVTPRFRVELVRRPAWMPASLHRRIAATLVPKRKKSFDPKLPEKIHAKAAKNPWIRSVEKVERCPGGNPNVMTIRLYARFRKPIAQVRVGTGLAFLDADGIRLPADQVPLWVANMKLKDGSRRQVCFINREEVPPGVFAKPIHYIAINGVRKFAPPVGHRWGGKDVADGLKLIVLFTKKSYANQITVVDVRNHGGQISSDEPHLRLYAHIPDGKVTDIRFGRFPRPEGDSNVSPRRKISYIDEYVARHGGRLAGMNPYLDLRHDNLHEGLY